MARPQVSVVVPVFDDGVSLRRLLDDLRGSGFEIVVADGGSSDDSVSVACSSCRLVTAPRGRGIQLDAGARAANGDWIWFVHADTRLPVPAAAALADKLDRPGWGFFRVSLDGQSLSYRVIERAMTWRSAATGIATGDQGIFVHRELLDRAGGVPKQPLMEDIELCRRLRRLAKPCRLSPRLIVSSRRWERYGVVRTILQMWWLRLRYCTGADPNELAERYYG